MPVHSLGDPALGGWLRAVGANATYKDRSTVGLIEAGENWCARLASCSITNLSALEGLILC